jgi:hypothetical protein
MKEVKGETGENTDLSDNRLSLDKNFKNLRDPCNYSTGPRLSLSG